MLASVDERSFGAIPDGQEMLSAAVALVRFGELGVSRDFAYAARRPGGDATTRYGMGQTLVEALPVSAALVLRGALPRRASAPLFVLLQVFLLAVAAGAATWAAGSAGLARAPAVLLGTSLVLATPLLGYASSDYAEPLQVSSLTVLAGAVLSLRLRNGGKGSETAAGAAAGVALLAKSSLLAAAAPLLWAAFTARPAQEPVPRARRKAAAATEPRRWRVLVAFAVPALLWAAFELARFGTLFGGYGGERFSYPFLTGLLRLTLLPNKGLLFYAPLVALAVPGFLAARRRDPRLALALALAAAAVLATAAGWWAWDGQAGWGPRLVLPALPMLFALLALGLPPAGAAMRRAAVGLGAAGLAINTPGALVPFPQVYALASAATPQPMPEGRARGTPYEVERRADGVLEASAPHHLSLTPAWAPQRVHARVLLAKLSGSPVPARLATLEPPFQVTLPEAPAPALEAALSRFAWPFWGRSWLAPLPGSADPLGGALRDQAIRALDLRDDPRAERLAASLGGSDPVDLAIAAEAAALQGRGADADALLARAGGSCHPWILFVRIRRGGGALCVPEPQRSAFERGVRTAIAAGAPLSAWGRGG